MAGKQYAGIEHYEGKLDKVMERLAVEEYNYDWGKRGGWVEFRYKGQLYRFEHSVEKAQAKGQKLVYGTDAFAQLVLALEDLARIAEREIYDLQGWIQGMLYLPPPVVLPECFREIGFTALPGDVAEINDRYRGLAKTAHPDHGGSDEAFIRLQRAAEQCRKYLEEK